MTYRRVHLALCAHGSPTSEYAIRYACSLTKAFDASLRVTSPHLKVTLPAHWVAGQMLARVANEVQAAAAVKTAELEACVRREAAILGISVEMDCVQELWPSDVDDAPARGRTSDLNVIGLPRHDIDGRLKVETWLFGTGRPCLLYPDDREQPFSLASVVIAWDLSKSAARAVGDALPMLKRARAVHVLTVRGEKEIPTADPAAPLIGYLATHDVGAVSRQVEIQDRHVGTAILTTAADLNADLLVMGAFGHSRVKEFVLGGATKEVLDAAALPLLMAH